MNWRILGQKCHNIMHKRALICALERAVELLPCLQGHRPEQQEQADRKKSDGGKGHMGRRPGAKVFVNHVNKNHQPSELDNLRPSYLMTLQRCHANTA